MCFSARASFGASAVLLVISAAAINKAQTLPQRILGCVPLIFSAQQFSEGVLWLTFLHAEYGHWRNAAMYTFLTFAQVVWPIFIPITVLLLEKDNIRKKTLMALLCVGVLLSGYLAFCLLMYPVSATMADHHISYNIPFLPDRNYTGLVYFIPTVVAPLVSRIKPIRLIGIIIIVSYLFTRVLYRYYIISVWCYFAAIISVVVLFAISGLNRNAGAGLKQFPER